MERDPGKSVSKPASYGRMTSRKYGATTDARAGFANLGHDRKVPIEACRSIVEEAKRGTLNLQQKVFATFCSNSSALVFEEAKRAPVYLLFPSESQMPPPENRAVFLDRDGVINRPLIRAGKPYPPATLDEFEILPDVREACQLLKTLGFLLVVATNQPDVGRGTLAREAVETIHTWMMQQLPIDRVMTCFHGGAVYGDPCECRKPQPGMLLQAAEALKIDLAKSFMIGDRWRDVDCGFQCGM